MFLYVNIDDGKVSRYTDGEKQGEGNGHYMGYQWVLNRGLNKLTFNSATRRHLMLLISFVEESSAAFNLFSPALMESSGIID